MNYSQDTHGSNRDVFVSGSMYRLDEVYFIYVLLSADVSYEYNLFNSLFPRVVPWLCSSRVDTG